MTRDEFQTEIGRLWVLRNAPEDATPWFEPLREIPAEMFKIAVDLALETRTFFPVPAELRADVDVVAVSFRRQQPPIPDRYEALDEAFSFDIRNPASGVLHRFKVTRWWKYECNDCHDTGRRSYWCGLKPAKDWYHVRSCDRRNEHPAHEWVGECVCAPHNSELRRARERAQERFSKEPAKAGR